MGDKDAWRNLTGRKNGACKKKIKYYTFFNNHHSSNQF